MKKQSIILGFSRYNNGQLAVKVRTIISRMTGNPNFPEPFPKLEDVEVQADNYDAALQTLDRSETRKLGFGKERSSLERMLRQLGLYVLQHGEDDPVILESSGFDLTKVPERRFMDQVVIEDFRVKPEEARGAMSMKCNSVAGSKVYYFQYTPAPVTDDSQWISETGTRPFKLLEGLKPGVEYAFRISVVGAGARIGFSEVILRHAS